MQAEKCTTSSCTDTRTTTVSCNPCARNSPERSSCESFGRDRRKMRRNVGNIFRRFSISRENCRKKIHEKSSTFSTVHQNKFFSLLQLWGPRGPSNPVIITPNFGSPFLVDPLSFHPLRVQTSVKIMLIFRHATPKSVDFLSEPWKDIPPAGLRAHRRPATCVAICLGKRSRRFAGNGTLAVAMRSAMIGRTPRGSCNRTLLRRVLRRFSNSKRFLEGFLERACKGFSVKTRFLEGFLEGSFS